MNTVKIVIEAKHARLIAHLLKQHSAHQVFGLLSEIKDKTADELEDDAEVTLNVSPDDVLLVYPMLSELPEGLAASVNAEMDALLLPQVNVGVNDKNEGWIYIAEFIAKYKADWSARLAAMIESGKGFLTP